MKTQDWLQTAVIAVTCAWPLGLAAADPDPTAAAAAATPANEAPANETPVSETPAASADDPFSFFLQEAEVVTASRRAQKKSDSPVAIDVISHDEIARSGAQSLYELLRFRVGVDVMEGNVIEGNPALVNVRGLPEEISHALQVLVDGRSIVSVLNSGMYWRRLPVDLEDIERIEIVRGPNSALFGANAGQGVINIITIAPGGNGGAKLQTGTGGLIQQQMALDSGPAAWAVRGSYSAGKRDSYPDVRGDIPVWGNSTGSEERARIRMKSAPWEGGGLDLSAGLLRERYSFPTIPGMGGANGIESNYAAVKLDHELREGLGLELNASRREERVSVPLSGGRETVFDVDVLGRIDVGEGFSQTVLGASLRYGEVDFRGLFSNSSHSASLYAYTAGPGESERLNRLRRAYLSEQLRLAEWVILALAASYEGSDTGGEQPAYQGSLILKPMEDWSLRVSASRSPTMPSLLNRYSRLERVTGVSFPYAGPFAAVPRLNVVRLEGTAISPTLISNYEASLQAHFLGRRLSAELTGFQMEISGNPIFETGGINSFDPPGFFPGKRVTVLYFRNQLDIVVRGVETVLGYRPSKGIRLQVNHTYMDVQAAKPSALYDGTTPWNKVNLISAFELPYGFNVAGGVNFVGEHRVYFSTRGFTLQVPDQAKVDLRLGYRPVADVEFFAVGQNLAHAYRTESPDGLAIPQTYSGGVNVVWGGR